MVVDQYLSDSRIFKYFVTRSVSKLKNVKNIIDVKMCISLGNLFNVYIETILKKIKEKLIIQKSQGSSSNYMNLVCSFRSGIGCCV